MAVCGWSWQIRIVLTMETNTQNGKSNKHFDGNYIPIKEPVH